MTRTTKSTPPKHPEITEREPLNKSQQAEHDKAVKAQEKADQDAAKELESQQAEAAPEPTPEPAAPKVVKPAGHDLPTAQEVRSQPQPQDPRKDPEQPGSVVQNVIPEEQAKDPTAPEQPK